MMNSSKQSSRVEFFFVAIIVLFAALLIRGPLISAGLPYLYREDDTHHLNRTIEMVKRRDLNPYYFHKPSLHFYVRMPVVWLTAQWMMSRGDLDSIKSVRTRDPYGLAGYNFTASHPLIVKTNRLLSIVLSLMTILVAMVIAFRLGVSAALTGVTGLIISFSPEFLINSPIVGVDILMALLTVLSSWCALEVFWRYSRFRVYLLAVLCGLAISSKYNAAPIAALPFLVGFLRRDFSIVAATLCGLLTLAGFFVGSPYILVSLQTFIEQVSYEVWHYRVAGHAGHSAEPGFPQAMFYAKWLVSDGVGYGATLLALIGLVWFTKQRVRESALLFTFPILFAGLMIAQKTNFTRNMVPFIPYVGIAAAFGLHHILQFIHRTRFFVGVALAAAAIFPISLDAVRLVTDEYYQAESRRDVVTWIESNYAKGDIAVSGELLLPIEKFSLPGVDAFNRQRISLLKLVQDGYSYFVVPAPEHVDVESLKIVRLVKSFDGANPLDRIVKNPAIDVYGLSLTSLSTLLQNEELPTKEFQVREDAYQLASCKEGGEEHCWINSRASRLVLVGKELAADEAIVFEGMSPWQNQKVQFYIDGNVVAEWVLPAPGEWHTITVKFGLLDKGKIVELRLLLSEIHSPMALGLSQDNRRLGIAVRRISVVKD